MQSSPCYGGTVSTRFLIILVLACALPAAAIAAPFGGAISELIKCNDGSVLLKIGSPTPMTIMYQLGTSYSYREGPPTAVSQWLLGLWNGMGVCTVGKSAHPPAPLITFHGSSGVGTQAAPLPETAQCSGNADLASASGPALEQAVRDDLKTCGGIGKAITVNKAACPAGASPKTVPGGCTSVGGLLCETTSSLCNLAKVCGPFTITGGSEGGHTYHGGGSAVDISSKDSKFNKCIQSLSSTPCPPQYKGGACYRDYLGTTYWREPQVGIEPEHWHVCQAGKIC